jgi:two-component system sensor histidine kinase KdpD
VVVAFAECHGRARTEAMLDGLEVVPRARCAHRGGQLEEMDLAAALARWPRVALVDEFAHTDVTGGGRRPKRRHSVEVLLDAGIDVMTAVNVQHLESLRPERLWQRPLPEPAGAVVAEAVRREADGCSPGCGSA